MLNTTTFIQYLSTDVPHLCPFIAIGLFFCANLPFRPSHLEPLFLLTDFYLPPDVTSLLGNISYPSKTFVRFNSLFYCVHSHSDTILLDSHIIFSSLHSGYISYNPRISQYTIDSLRYTQHLCKLHRLSALRLHFY